MNRLGWIVAGAVLGLAASAAAGVLAANRTARARFAVSARQGRQWMEETGERYRAGALQARDRAAQTTEDLRDRMAGTADQWRERGTEQVGRRLLSAAEARDASLEDDDADEDDESDDARRDGADEGR